MSDSGHHRHEHRLVVDSLSVNYAGVEALRDVSFETTCGHRLAVLGPNGAGKSTLIRTLAGLVRPTRGRIHWRGRRLEGSSREIAYLPHVDQHRKDFPITVREVVAMGRLPHLGIWRSMRALDEERVEEALDLMKLGPLVGRQIDHLSGGQRQRAFLARALAQEAHIVMLDEPFSGLDVESSAEFGLALQELGKRGHLVIASHHDLATVGTLFDHALVLKREQVAFGPVDEVLARAEVRHALGFRKEGGGA
jgi:ABC-type Mn2+/Zn2+ transport system ATPase subunit